jgi:hypothetical protein
MMKQRCESQMMGAAGLTRSVLKSSRPTAANALRMNVFSTRRAHFLKGGKMQITADLNRKVVKAVQTSMCIEGYKPVQSANIKAQAKSLMEQGRVQVSVPGK